MTKKKEKTPALLLLWESGSTSFISEAACWSVAECEILEDLWRDTGSCHWLALTFSVMVMTFCWSGCMCVCVCSCRWLWDGAKLSRSKVKKNEDQRFFSFHPAAAGRWAEASLLCLSFNQKIIIAFKTGKNVLLFSAANLLKLNFESDARAWGWGVHAAASQIAPLH